MAGRGIDVASVDSLIWAESVSHLGPVGMKFDSPMQRDSRGYQQRNSGEKRECAEAIPESDHNRSRADAEDQGLQAASDDDQGFIDRDTHESTPSRT